MGSTCGWTLAMVAAVGSVFGAPDAASGSSAGNAQVAGGSWVNVREGPATTFPVVRIVPDSTRLEVRCQVDGQTISGAVRTTVAWNRLDDGRYISDAYVSWPGGVPAAGACPADVAVPAVRPVDDRASRSSARATPPVAGRGVAATAVNLRPNASTVLGLVGDLPAGRDVPVSCQLAGETPSGAGSALWDQVVAGQFVADSFVRWPGGRPDIRWCSFPAAVPPSGPAFVDWAAAHAVAAKAAHGVPSSVTIAQAILESGWGRSDLTRDGNSFFGMKCFGSPGPYAVGCRPYGTYECGDSTCYRTSAGFRVYDSPLASFEDHSYALASLSRYRAAFAYTNDPDRFARSIANAGYATSPTYAEDLIALMREFDLYRYDR